MLKEFCSRKKMKDIVFIIHHLCGALKEENYNWVFWFSPNSVKFWFKDAIMQTNTTLLLTESFLWDKRGTKLPENMNYLDRAGANHIAHDADIAVHYFSCVVF